MPVGAFVREVFPGLALAGVVAGVAGAVEWIEIDQAGYAYVDGLVAAILAGTLLRTGFGLKPRFGPGVTFAAKTILEIAIVLLGGTVSTAAIFSLGVPLIVTVLAVVMLALVVSYGVGRLVGLNQKLALLVACGNSICGNSAIMAAAPVIDARSEDVASSIGFTAVLGMVVILLLPITVYLFGLSEWQYGVVAGLSVYAVPQVVAAAAPIGPLSAQIGTIVKLVRVLMLGPLVLAIGLRYGQQGQARLPVTQFVPWFILGFGILLAARSSGLLPDALVGILQQASFTLTLVAMAGLGLSVDLRSVLASGGRVLTAGVVSILCLVALAILAARLVAIT
ncbi:putative sulfate exporter family transporter [Ochrobactrum sp. Kaboul]|nr:putative sulfate exporter family transporter [Rhizobium sp. P007]KAB2693144.1 putative sulfate exporter family transporter [Ochrobactrum sp. Kaboul]HCJ73207.1 putative sulfate exporter family transporter [Agrobacterium sp.]